MSRKLRGTIALLSAALIVAAVTAHANPKIQKAFLAKYPDAKGSKIAKCATCHAAKPPALNAYGKDLKAAHADFAAIEAKDSDGDGATNVAEIKAATLPGDAKDKPAMAATESTATDSTAKAKPDSTAKPDSAKGGN